MRAGDGCAEQHDKPLLRSHMRHTREHGRFTNSYVDKATTEVHCCARVLDNNTHDHGSVCAPNK